MKNVYNGTSLSYAFNYYKRTPSDINEHIETLFKYGKLVNSIVELGVRTGRSTTAFLYSKPKSLISIDLKKHNQFNSTQFYKWAKENDINFSFRIDNSLTMNPFLCDLLFIDTYHTYDQLSQELQIHGSHVRKFIILHDTITFGKKGEDNKIPGLEQAIDEFINYSKWKIKEEFFNNNGLVILEK